MNALQRIRYRLLNALDQLFMILNLPTFTSDLDGRMRRLRRIYYHNPAATMSHGRVRDIVHGHVGQRYREFYEQVLMGERTIYHACMRMPAAMDHETILYQAQRLGDALVALVEDLQDIDTQLKNVRQRSTNLADTLQLQRTDILQQLNEGLTQQAQIPIRLQTLLNAKQDRDMGRITQEIGRLTQYAEDIAATYEEIHAEQMQRGTYEN